jgi:uncharacterized protein (TIGR02757 family)
MPIKNEVADLLNAKFEQYNQPNFIANDPISIPHRFSKKQDIEIMGFMAATLAWGQRITIINSCTKFANLMDNSPYDFIKNHQSIDLKVFNDFKHRTFNSTDALHFIETLKKIYENSDTLETAFLAKFKTDDINTKSALIGFNELFFEDEFAPQRTQKHVASPKRKSSCKRLNMFLRWMVRNDTQGVDFGLWQTIKPAQLVMPIDVHVERVSRILGLIQTDKINWQAAEDLTETLKELDAQDPVKYDFALFGLGVEGEM